MSKAGIEIPVSGTKIIGIVAHDEDCGLVMSPYRCESNSDDTFWTEIHLYTFKTCGNSTDI